MHNHRQNADISDFGDLRTRRLPWTLPDLLSVICGVVLILSVYAFAQAADERSALLEEPVREVDLAEAYRAEVEEAYDRGIADAVAALCGSADGIALAHRCAVLAGARP